MNLALELKELMLRKPRWTLAVAESLTAGNVQARIAAVSGASNFFLGGVTAYSIEEKVKLLGVDRAAAARVNCVSAEIAGQMARGACELFGANIGVATTGYAEPSPAEGVTTPFAWWAVAVRTGAKTQDSSAETVRSIAASSGREADTKRKSDGSVGEFLLRHGRVECPGAKRIEVQAIVAEAAIAELVNVLRELRA